MSKEFDVNYIIENGQRHMRNDIKIAADKLIDETIFRQTNIIESEMEKVIAELSPEQLKKVSIALENITYAAGRLKGLMR